MCPFSWAGIKRTTGAMEDNVCSQPRTGQFDWRPSGVLMSQFTRELKLVKVVDQVTLEDKVIPSLLVSLLNTPFWVITRCKYQVYYRNGKVLHGSRAESQVEDGQVFPLTLLALDEWPLPGWVRTFTDPGRNVWVQFPVFTWVGTVAWFLW